MGGLIQHDAIESLMFFCFSLLFPAVLIRFEFFYFPLGQKKVAMMAVWPLPFHHANFWTQIHSKVDVDVFEVLTFYEIGPVPNFFSSPLLFEPQKFLTLRLFYWAVSRRWIISVPVAPALAKSKPELLNEGLGGGSVRGTRPLAPRGSSSFNSGTVGAVLVEEDIGRRCCMGLGPCWEASRGWSCGGNYAGAALQLCRTHEGTRKERIQNLYTTEDVAWWS